MKNKSNNEINAKARSCKDVNMPSGLEEVESKWSEQI